MATAESTGTTQENFLESTENNGTANVKGLSMTKTPGNVKEQIPNTENSLNGQSELSAATKKRKKSRRKRKKKEQV